jgi:hypothetical protein
MSLMGLKTRWPTCMECWMHERLRLPSARGPTSTGRAARGAR